MAVIILLVCFLAVFLTTGILLGPQAGKKETLVCSVIIFSVIIVLVTELLGAFNLLTYNFILLLWSIITLSNIFYLYKKRLLAVDFVNALKQRIAFARNNLTRYEQYVLYAVFIILALIFIQGIIYPPNNWDSMAYHMARIPNWISHKSLAPYPTHIDRQIYQPPFAEYAILNIDLLSGSDYLSNTIQLFFLLASLIAVVCIVKVLGLSRLYQIIAFVLAATIPEVVLEASSTQNDIVVSFFILSSVYFAVRAVIGGTAKNYLFLAFAAGLGILTKGIAGVFLVPIVFIFGIGMLWGILRTKNYRPLLYSALAIFIVLGINAPQFYRNYSVTSNILGTDAAEMQAYSNQKMSPVLLLSGIIKNCGLHMGMIGTNRVANIADKVIYKADALMGVDINSPANNFNHTKYSSPQTFAAAHEDSAPNFIHFILLLVSVILIDLHALKNKTSTGIQLLALTIFLQGLLFCLYLKWQPWNTRLHVPLFMLALPLIGYAASINRRFKKTVVVIIPLILIYALIIVSRNVTRPYINSQRPYVSSNMAIFDTRYQKYFANVPGYYNEYCAIVKNIQQLNYKNIGLILNDDAYEYPLFTHCYTSPINPVSIFVNNDTKNIKPYINTVDCIVSTTVNHPFIEYKGKRFYNQDAKNKYVYLYE
jgi:4-amino-4-deoxy-L-arabinose transferase-like glycosyltransferase